MRIINQIQEYQIELHLAFVDFKKAFDTVKQTSLVKALVNQGVSTSLNKIINNSYTDIKARILTNQEGEYFNEEREVKQG